MIHMTLNEAAQLLDIELPKVNATFEGISIDSRLIPKNALFIALPGSRVDGHDFIATAKEKGAAAALVSRRVACDLPQLLVQDIVAALGKLGTTWRDRFQIPFIAVTGSNGKTTLKNMIGSILTAACNHDGEKVLVTQGTLNNHLGLPLTLARLNANHQYAVIEMGMNHFGEIEYLTKLTHPQIAVITNAGASHLEGVGDLAGVARAKGEIFLGLPADGSAVLNRDDAYYDYWYQLAGQRPIISFGLNKNADVYATQHASQTTTQHLTVHTPKGDIDLLLPLLGKHNIQNALAATAVALAAKIDLAAIKYGLENIKPANGRMQTHQLKNGTTLIDDTYNANPFSLQAAIHTLATFPGQRLLVLGDMKELGSDEKNLHHTAGQQIRAAGINQLFTLGPLAQHTAQAFGENAHHYSDQTELCNALKPFLQKDTTILIKGSRSMHMENIVKGLIATSTELQNT